jgi:hypothetical protein
MYCLPKKPFGKEPTKNSYGFHREVQAERQIFLCFIENFRSGEYRIMTEMICKIKVLCDEGSKSMKKMNSMPVLTGFADFRRSRRPKDKNEAIKKEAFCNANSVDGIGAKTDSVKKTPTKADS